MFVRNGEKLGSVLVDKASTEPVPTDPDTDAPTDDDLEALRADAEAAGVKVDGRWGADRLREAIDATNDQEEDDGDDQLS